MKAFLLLIGVLIVSFSGILVKLSTTAPQITAFYRVFFAFVTYIVVLKGRIQRFDKKKELLLLLAGFCLAMHFYFWISAFKHTTVAGAVIPLMIQPLVASVLGALLYREKVGKKETLGVVIVIVGVMLMTILDSRVSLSISKGDLLSVIGVIFVSVYLVIGRYLVPKTSALVFNMRSYLIASVILFFVTPTKIFQTFPLSQWLVFLGLGIGCSFFGYTLINNSLRYFKTGIVAMALVGEPVLSIVWSWIIFFETPTLSQYIGLVISVSGLVIFFSKIARSPSN